MQENTEDLITALVGSSKGDSGTNIKKSLDSMKTTLEKAIRGFVRKLDRKFQSIQLWSAALVCPGKCLQPWIYTPDFSRRLIHQNGTEEEYKQGLAWLNETLNDADLTEEEKVVQAYVMSNPDILSRLLQPIYQSALTDVTNTPQNKLLDNQKEDVDAIAKLNEMKKMDEYGEKNVPNSLIDNS